MSVGTLYVIVYPSSLSTPSAAQVEGGLDSTGAAAIYSDATTAGNIGTYEFNPTNLAVGNSYKAAFVWKGTAYTSPVEESLEFTFEVSGSASAAFSLRDIFNLNEYVVRLRH